MCLCDVSIFSVIPVFPAEKQKTSVKTRPRKGSEELDASNNNKKKPTKH